MPVNDLNYYDGLTVQKPVRIAIASGKGGTGKTFVATNIFYTLGKSGIDAVLVDCDAEAPNAAVFFETLQTGSLEVTQLIPVIDADKCTFCGKCHEYCNYNAIFILPPVKIITVIEDICHGCGACSVACKYGAISEKPVSLGKVGLHLARGKLSIVEAKMKIGVRSPVPVIRAALEQIDDRRGIVILDSPPGTSCPFVQSVSEADYVILVTEPTPFGLSDLKLSVEILRKTGKPFGVIINRAGLGNNMTAEYLSSEMIPLLLEIPFSLKIAEKYSNGEIASATDLSLAKQFETVVKNIIMQNGNSGH